MPSVKAYTMNEMFAEIKKDAPKNMLISLVLIVICLLLGHYIAWMDKHFWLGLATLFILWFGLDQLLKLVPDEDVSQEKYPSTTTRW